MLYAANYGSKLTTADSGEWLQRVKDETVFGKITKTRNVGQCPT